MVRKFLMSCFLMSFIILVNIGYAYSLQVIVDGQSITIEKNANEAVTLNILRSDCLGWKVIQGNVVITEDSFIMPAENVIIEAIIPTEYPLITGVNGIVIESNQPVESSVTISAGSTLGNAFKWLSWGMILTNSTTELISFKMPYNEVRLNAN